MNDVMYPETVEYMEMTLGMPEAVEEAGYGDESMEDYEYGDKPKDDCKHDDKPKDDCKHDDKPKDDCKHDDKPKDDCDKKKECSKCHDKDKDNKCEKKHDPDDTDPMDACCSNFYQMEKISVPVKITPYATPGEASVTCSGRPVVMNGNRCEGNQSYCTFTVTQALYIEIPISFGARVETGIAVVECGMAGTDKCD